jgi:hypothetical protein
MTQTRKQSGVEAATNLVVGYLINMGANFVIFPIMGWSITLGQNLTIGVFYAIVSLLRSYGLRRFYNWCNL